MLEGKLLELIQGKKPKDSTRRKVKTYGFDTCDLTNQAFEKACRYAQITCEEANESMECGGFLTQSIRSRDRVATDAFLAYRQNVWGGLYRVEGKDISLNNRYIEPLGLKICGWWHNHGEADTFFSPLDRVGQKTVLNFIARLNKFEVEDEAQIENLEIEVSNGRVLLYDRRNPDVQYVLRVDNLDKVDSLSIRYKKKQIGLSYGLVVNTRKEYYAENAIREYCGNCHHGIDNSFPVQVRIHDIGKVELDDDELRQQVRERVRMRGGWFSHRDKTYEHPGMPFGDHIITSEGIIIPGLGTSSFDTFGTESGKNSYTIEQIQSQDGRRGFLVWLDK